MEVKEILIVNFYKKIKGIFSVINSINLQLYINLREAHGSKTLVLLQGARRANTPSPEGEEYEPFRASSWVLVDGLVEVYGLCSQ